MTIPIWAPFAFLTAVCAVRPLPGWARRVDWPMVAFWVLYLAVFTYGMLRLVWWLS